MAKILIYNGTTPEWIEVNAATVDASGEAPLLKFDAVENFVEEFLADTEAGATNRQQMADTMAANETFVNDVATTEQLAINVAADTQLATNVVAVEGFIGDVASDLVANHLEQIKGEPGESFQIDDSGELTTAIAAGIMEESGASSTDFYLYLVTVDNRNLEDLEEGLEGIDAANQNTLDDLSRHVIMWDGQSWHDYGQFTALQGPTGPTGAQGEQGVQGEQGSNYSELTFTFIDGDSFNSDYDNDINMSKFTGKIMCDVISLPNIERIYVNISDKNNVSLLNHNIQEFKKYEITLSDNQNNYGVYTTNPNDTRIIKLHSTNTHSDQYRGFKASICRFWKDDPSINQIIIYNENEFITASISQPDTDFDDFKVSGLTNNSNIVVVLNAYGNNSSNPLSNELLIQFFHDFIDNVIYTDNNLNDIQTIQTNFYANFNTFTNSISNLLYNGFDFDGYGSDHISDGDSDQYDDGNYINTNLKNHIPYGDAGENNQGTIITGELANEAFGQDSSYVTLYNNSIFAMVATNANITSIGYDGETGADGDGYKELLLPEGATIAVSDLLYDFNNCSVLKATDSDLIDGNDIKFSIKLLGDEKSKNVSRWTNPDSGNRWNIETYNNGGVFKLKANQQTTNGSVSLITHDSQTNVNFIRITHSVDVLNFIDNDLNPAGGQTQFSFDNGLTWINYNFSISYSNPNGIYYDIFVDQQVSYDIGVAVSYRQFFEIESQSTPVTWWNYNNTPSADDGNFRGAIINYHALTDDGTIIGTIHISKDSGDENVVHTESKSGSSNINNHILWYCTNEGILKYTYDEEFFTDKTLRIHWTSTVFNGPDYEDD